MFVPLDGEAPEIRPFRVVIIDVRNGNVYADGSNLDVPEEGREGVLRAIETADVLVEISTDNMWVKKGVEHGVVALAKTRSEAQMSNEKALRESAARATGPEIPAGMVGDRATFEDDPVDAKFARVWDDTVPSGKPVEGGLKGY
jgi:hypothetical protein